MSHHPVASRVFPNITTPPKFQDFSIKFLTLWYGHPSPLALVRRIQITPPLPLSKPLLAIYTPKPRRYLFFLPSLKNIIFHLFVKI